MLVLESKGQPPLSMRNREKIFFFFITAFREAFLRVFLTVCEEIGVLTTVLMKWVA